MVLSQYRLELWPVKGASSQLLDVFNLLCFLFSVIIHLNTCMHKT